MCKRVPGVAQTAGSSDVSTPRPSVISPSAAVSYLQPEASKCLLALFICLNYSTFILTHFNWMTYGYLLCFVHGAFDWQQLLNCCSVSCDWPLSLRLLHTSRPIARLLGDTSHSAHARVDRQPPHPLIKPANLSLPPNRLHAYESKHLRVRRRNTPKFNIICIHSLAKYWKLFCCSQTHTHEFFMSQ